MAREHNFKWNSDVCGFAALNGNLEMLKWAKSNGCNWNLRDGKYELDVASSAAVGGHLEIVKWARANGCKWNWEVCIFAAFYGRLDIFKYVLTSGIDWDLEKLCIDINSDCQGIDSLEWANEYKWEKFVCMAAAQNNHLYIYIKMV